jgi:ribosome-associated translation inhibitor RaiA
MTTYIDVSFRDVSQNASIEAAIHRWVARLEAMRIEVQRAEVTVEPFGRKRTMISATVRLTNGHVETRASVHTDPYVCIANAFRAIRQAQPIPATTARRPSFA